MDDEKEKNDKPWQWKKGQSGNPAGRPPGKTMKEFARDFLSKMDEQERLIFFYGLDKIDIWKMAEGNPHSTSDVKETIILPTPLDDISKDDFIPEDKAPEEAN